MARDSNIKPLFLTDDPAPYREDRIFHGRALNVWMGEVGVDKIKGWPGNPRTELQFEQFRVTYGRPPGDDEMYQIVLADKDPKEGIKIRELAGNISQNGVRMPIVLTYEGDLLDGNRRYYACRFLATDGASPQERRRFKTIPAIVLPEGTGDEAKNDIMTEFNFAPDYRVEWPYYVKAMKVYDDYVDNDLDKDDLVNKYGLEWRTLSKWIAAAKLCQRFLRHHEDPVTGKPSYLAQKFAYNYFIMFDEMARNYNSKLNQADFREAIFDLLLSGYENDAQRFKKSADMVRLDEIWDNPDGAWTALTTQMGPKALQQALDIVNQSNSDNGPDPNPTMKTVVRKLEKQVSGHTLGAADKELLQQFHHLAEQVPGAPSDPSTQVDKMIEWLDAMTSRQIEALGAETLGNLGKALDRVLKMAAAVAVS